MIAADFSGSFIKEDEQILELDQVDFSWPSGIKALQKCSFKIPRKGLWMIVGPNGSGKSTLFKLITGILSPQSGHIYCGCKPSLLFQNPDHQLLLPSCGSDILLSLPSNLSSRIRRQRISNVLEQVGMKGMESRPIHTLSGGQKQRLALAGALAGEGGLLLLDEPTALLDPESQQSILRLVKKLCQRSKDPITALWITHRLEELDFCDGAAIMSEGKVGQWLSGASLTESIKRLAVRRV